MNIDPDRLAAVARNATARVGHHEAGHAVAAVARRGRLISVHLGQVDWLTSDPTADKPAETCHQTALHNQPFVTFAGPWAEAMWTVANEDGVDDFDEALEYAWENNVDGDTARYENRITELREHAEELGLPVWQHVWEDAWIEELDLLWSAVREVAALLIDGQTVTHDAVLAAVEKAEREF